MPKDPMKVAQKWANGLGNATQSYIDGINGTTVNPMQRAIAAIPKYQANVNAAVQSGKLQRGLSRVSEAEWKQRATQVGATKLAQGAADAKGKMESFLSQWLPFVDSVRNKVNSMPSTTKQDRLNKMIANATALSEFRRT